MQRQSVSLDLDQQFPRPPGVMFTIRTCDENVADHKMLPSSCALVSAVVAGVRPNLCAFNYCKCILCMER